MKQTKLEKIILELTNLGKEYRNAEDKLVREHYDNYAGIIVGNNVNIEHRENLYSYWEGLKKGDYDEKEIKFNGGNK